MMKHVIAGAVMFLLLAAPAGAQENTKPASPEARKAHTLLFPEDKNLVRPEDVKRWHAAGQEAKETILEHREAVKATIDARQTAIKENVMERRAEFASSTAVRREALKDKILERRTAFASSTALRKAALAENVKERVIERAGHAVRLLEAMLTRLAGLADRIQARIDLLDERGADTAAAKAELAEAEAAIETAADAVAAVKAAIERALDSETPREALQEVKPLAEAAKAALRAAHQALIEAAHALPKPPAEDVTSE